MSSLNFKLNRSGVSELMKSGEMQGILTDYASAVRKRCGAGYEQDSYTGRNRSNAMVYAKTYQAKKDNARNNTILKAVHS